VLNDGAGKAIVEDFTLFDWRWLYSLTTKIKKIGQLKYNTLWISPKESTTMVGDGPDFW